METSLEGAQIFVSHAAKYFVNNLLLLEMLLPEHGQFPPQRLVLSLHGTKLAVQIFLTILDRLDVSKNFVDDVRSTFASTSSGVCNFALDPVQELRLVAYEVRVGKLHLVLVFVHFQATTIHIDFLVETV